MKKADLALYHAKAAGRNRYAIFEAALGQAAVAKHTLENEFVQGLLRVMRSEEFGTAVAQLPGYAAKDAGVVKGIREALR